MSTITSSWRHKDLSVYPCFSFYKRFAHSNLSTYELVEVMRNRGHEVRLDAMRGCCPIWYCSYYDTTRLFRFNSSLSRLCIQVLLICFLDNIRTFDLPRDELYDCDVVVWFYIRCLALYFYDHLRKIERRRLRVPDFDEIRRYSASIAIEEYVHGCEHRNVQLSIPFMKRDRYVFLTQDWTHFSSYVHYRKKVNRYKVFRRPDLDLYANPYQCFKVPFD